jgi:hypothetical protein
VVASEIVLMGQTNYSYRDKKTVLCLERLDKHKVEHSIKEHLE